MLEKQPPESASAKLLPIYRDQSPPSMIGSEVPGTDFSELTEQFRFDQKNSELPLMMMSPEAVARTCVGGVLDGGPYAHRHPRVWRAALLYGLASHQQPYNGVKWALLRKAEGL